MSQGDDRNRRASRLRAAAEGQLESTPADACGAPVDVALTPTQALLHDLEVHQIELEMQNEALRQTTIALEESRDRYVDLYEFAPVGYLTLSSSGLIAEINLTGGVLLATERKNLLRRRFVAFVVAADQPRWARHFMAVKSGAQCGPLALTLQRGDGTLLQAQLDCRTCRPDSVRSVI